MNSHSLWCGGDRAFPCLATRPPWSPGRAGPVHHRSYLLHSQGHGECILCACMRTSQGSLQWLQRMGQCQQTSKASWWLMIQVFHINLKFCHIFFIFSHFYLKLVCRMYTVFHVYLEEKFSTTLQNLIWSKNSNIQIKWVSHLDNFLDKIKSGQ